MLRKPLFLNSIQNSPSNALVNVNWLANAPIVQGTELGIIKPYFLGKLAAR